MPPNSVAPLVYTVPPPVAVPSVPFGFTGQPAPFSFSSEFASPEDVFSRALCSSEKSEDPPQVPPPPKISQVIKVIGFQKI
jgi:hypothetical protein